MEMTIHKRMTERMGLAQIYAEDGAFFSAAKILAALADEVERHAKATLLPPLDMDDPSIGTGRSVPLRRRAKAGA